MADQPQSRAGQIEFFAAVGITVSAVILHIVFLFSAGGLWRDESGGVALATLPNFSEVWHELTHDSFPGLFVMVVRSWAAIFGPGDFALRSLGLLVGLGWLAAVWANARWLGLRTPLIALTVLGLNLTLIQWGDSLRAYGLGSVLVVLFFGRVWRFVKQASPLRFSLAAGLAVLAVQTLYQAAFLVAAGCLAGAVVAARRSRWSLAGMSLLVGAPAAASLLPYLKPLHESQAWWIVEKTGFNAPFTWHTLSTALDTPLFLGPWLWIAFLAAGIVYGMTWMERKVSRREDIAVDLPLFGACAAVAGLLGFFAFVVSAGLPTQPWYWLVLLSFFAVCLEATIGVWLSKQSIKLTWVAVGLAAVSLLSTAPRVSRTMTNIPEIAAKLKSDVQPNDLILVYPWYLGVSFQRSYSTNSAWLTVPDIADHRFHRYDQLKERLQQRDALHSVFAKIDATLQQGGRIWLVGGLPEPAPGEKDVPSLPPAPESESGWYDEPYNQMWGRQLDIYLRQKVRQIEPVLLPVPGRGTRYEQIPLFQCAAGL